MSVLSPGEGVNGVCRVNLRDPPGATDMVINSEILWFITENQEILLFREPVCGKVILNEPTTFLHVATIHETDCSNVWPGDINRVTEVTVERF